ncbi:MAG: 4Fe-4S binding protein [Deltaproteobacteria bacterium]|nr:4Fe-4S binding protein [Deltaproteobacteria bacterium]
MADVDLTVTIEGITFKNPIVAASGIITRSIHSVEKCIEAGAGAVVTKSITFLSSISGGKWLLPRPAIWLLDKYGDPGSSQNISIGNLPDKQGVEFVEQIKPITNDAGAILIANMNLMGDLEAYPEKEALERTGELATKLEVAGADMIEIMRACPIDVGRHSGGDWSEASDVDYTEKIIRTLKAEISIPFYLKLHTDVTFKNIKRLEDAGVSAHCVYSLLPATVIDIETGRPILPFPQPYYGRGITAHENYQTARLASVSKCPIITSGGTMKGRDVIERLMCGGTIIQVMTAAMYYGPKVFTDMIDELKSFMLRKGYRSVKDIIGVAVPHVNNAEEYAKFVEERQVPREAMAMTIDNAKCTGCGQCAVCPYGAMSMKDGFPKWDSKLCEFCGICQTICPVNAITIRRRTMGKGNQ